MMTLPPSPHHDLLLAAVRSSICSPPLAQAAGAWSLGHPRTPRRCLPPPGSAVFLQAAPPSSARPSHRAFAQTHWFPLQTHALGRPSERLLREPLTVTAAAGPLDPGAQRGPRAWAGGGAGFLSSGVLSRGQVDPAGRTQCPGARHSRLSSEPLMPALFLSAPVCPPLPGAGRGRLQGRTHIRHHLKETWETVDRLMLSGRVREWGRALGVPRHPPSHPSFETLLSARRLPKPPPGQARFCKRTDTHAHSDTLIKDNVCGPQLTKGRTGRTGTPGTPVAGGSVVEHHAAVTKERPPPPATARTQLADPTRRGARRVPGDGGG